MITTMSSTTNRRRLIRSRVLTLTALLLLSTPTFSSTFVDKDDEQSSSIPSQHKTKSTASTRLPSNRSSRIRSIGSSPSERPAWISKGGPSLKHNREDLSQTATRLLNGDSSSFVNELKNQEQRCKEQQTEQGSNKPDDNSVSTEKSVWTLAGTTLLIVLASFFDKGIAASSIETLQKLAQNSLSAMLLAWTPVLILGGGASVLGLGWFEMVSIGLLVFRQPLVRQTLLYDILPLVKSTGHKLLLAEIWKHIWKLIWSPLPQPLFTPKNVASQLRIPEWLKSIVQYMMNVIDKFTQGLVKSAIKDSIQTAVGELATSSADFVLPDFSIDWLPWDYEKSFCDAGDTDDTDASDIEDGDAAQINDEADDPEPVHSIASKDDVIDEDEE